jgi:hypothetical protein
MPSFLRIAFRSVSNFVVRMDMQEWAIVGACLVVVGVMCMRGYGSRSNY